jgi:fructose/tagatose bisphosphate aldolase
MEMEHSQLLREVAEPLGAAVRIDGHGVHVKDKGALRERIEPLVRRAVFSTGPAQGVAQWLLRECALGAGIIPSSIHALYMARGRGDTRNDFVVPAMNLRSLTYQMARAVFRAAQSRDAGAIIFEIARSEIGYTDQRPAAYAACVLGAGLAEGYHGPVFIQGDHFQVSEKRYRADPGGELTAVRGLIREALGAGFFNIDIDTSTLVDLSRDSIPDQQRLNIELSAELAAFTRRLEPAGVTVSIGGEIGEVGGQNSTEPELRAYMEGFNEHLSGINPAYAGLSKISIQTGTTHGGVVLPDGSVAQVKVDFQTLRRLSEVARKAYGLAGAVQHGASTLPESAFAHFAEAQACEVHLATQFQNILYERMPGGLKGEIYAYLDEHHAEEHKPGQTDEQFYYKTRKQALGPFKRQIWDLPQQARDEIEDAWQAQFGLLFEHLNVGGTLREVERHVRPVEVHVPLGSYLGEGAEERSASDLAD